MTKNHLFFFLFLLGFISCKPSVSSLKELPLVYDSVVIATDFPYLPQYMMTDMTERNGEKIAVGYNYMNHSYDLFNLTRKETAGVLEGVGEGPGDLLRNANLALFPDYLLAKTHEQLKVVTYDGQVVRSGRVNEMVDPVTGYVYKWAPGGISVGNHKVYGHTVPGSPWVYYRIFPVVSPEDPSFMDHSVGVGICPETLEVYYLPVKIKDIQGMDVVEYSHFGYPVLTASASGLMISVPYKPDVWLYDIQQNRLEKCVPQSQSLPLRLPPLAETSYKDLVRYELDGARYREIYKIEEQGIYFRVLYKDKDEDTGMRESYLMILDAFLQPVREIRLPSHFKDVFFVYGNYICFYLENPTEDIWVAQVDVSQNL